MRDVSVVIPAAGLGTRMQADCPKQYLRLNNQSLLNCTIKRFHLGVCTKLLWHFQKAQAAPCPTDRLQHQQIKYTIGGKIEAISVEKSLQLVEYPCHGA